VPREVEALVRRFAEAHGAEPAACRDRRQNPGTEYARMYLI
jgi:hypothetical protein